MVRKKRAWYPGAIYHIMCRGNHRHEIFRDDEDRQVYLENLVWAKRNYNCTILSYCLMTNHIHLQVETADVPIWKMMKQLNMMFAIYFNKKYNFVGYLFQGRYRDELIETDAYNLEISRYIHLNPVVAKIVESPLDYPWSSYQNFLGLRGDTIVSPEKILAYFPNHDPDLYQRYVEQF